MRTYKLAYLNKGLSLSMEKDLKKTEELINDYIFDDWTLQQVITPSDGTIVGIFYKDL